MTTLNAVKTPTSSSTPPPATASNDRRDPALLPPVDVVEDATGITLYADLPGVPQASACSLKRGRRPASTMEARDAGERRCPKACTPSHAEVNAVCAIRRAFTLSKELDAGQV